MTPPAPSPTGLALLAAEALAERTRVVMLGLPGSGRRSMIARVRSALPGDDWRTLQVAGSGPRPLEALTLGGYLPSTPGRVSLTAAVEGLSEAAGSGRALLVVTDADQLDDVSAAVIAAVLERTPLSLLAVARPPFPGPEALDHLIAGGDTTVMRIPPRPYDDMHRILADTVGGDLDTDTSGRIYALSGGLPGIARAIAVEARRAGRLTRTDTHWTAPGEVWTPALDGVVARLTRGVSAEEQTALRRLAELGPAELAGVQRLVPAAVLAALDDRGLLRLVEAEAPLVALFPPLLAEHLRHRGGDIRRRLAAVDVAAALDDDDSRALRTTAGRAQASASPPTEGAAIIGRLMREQATAAVPLARAQWERSPSDATALGYAHALLNSDAAPEIIDHLMMAARTLPSHDMTLDLVQLRAWEGTYRAFVRHDLAEGLAILDEAATVAPASATALQAVAAHLRLISGERTTLPDLPPPGDQTLAFPQRQTAEVVHMVRGEILTAGGRVEDALAEFAQVSSIDPLHADLDAMVPLARLVAGELDAALADARRQLDTARGTLERAQIDPYGYVVALGLYVRGRLGSLRDHLTAMFAVNAGAPLRPGSRAGLFGLGAEVALVEGNLPSARSLIGQAESLRLPGGPLPLARIAPAQAALAVLQGTPAATATEAAWRDIDGLISRGLVLAALLDGARLVDLHVDDDRTARLAALARAAQGRMMPLLAGYLEAALERSPDLLLAAAQSLWTHDLRLHSTRAHVMAVRLLREAGAVERATVESARLRSRVRRAGDDLWLLVPSETAPTAQLTVREREIANLVAGGMTNADVARHLQVSERTVDNHVYRIFRKLGIGSREELAGLL